MPLPILLAHRLTAGLADDRKTGCVGWLRPDGKSHVTVAYRDGEPARVTQILVSTQHAPDLAEGTIHAYVEDFLGPRMLGDWWSPTIEVLVNPSGSFEHGGPSIDTGLTGRKIIVDTYGGMARHGGGAFSFAPDDMISDLGLWTDVQYRRTTNYGHFGRPGFPWERD